VKTKSKLHKDLLTFEYLIILTLCNKCIFENHLSGGRKLFPSQRSWGDFLLPLVTTTSLETPFQFDVYIFSPLVKIHVLWLPPMKCRVFFSWLGCFFFVTWVNILSNMLILIVVMETTRTNHKNFQVVLHWHSYMPQQNDNHLRMIIMLQWHIAVSCDHVIAWDHIITISIQNIINIK